MQANHFAHFSAIPDPVKIDIVKNGDTTFLTFWQGDNSETSIQVECAKLDTKRCQIDYTAFLSNGVTLSQPKVEVSLESVAGIICSIVEDMFAQKLF